MSGNASEAYLRRINALHQQQNELWDERRKLDQDIADVQREREAYLVVAERATGEDREFIEELIGKCASRLRNLHHQDMVVTNQIILAGASISILLRQSDQEAMLMTFRGIVQTYAMPIVERAAGLFKSQDIEQMCLGDMLECDIEAFFGMLAIPELDDDVYETFLQRVFHRINGEDDLLAQYRRVVSSIVYDAVIAADADTD